jgi:hypothetical protein
MENNIFFKEKKNKYNPDVDIKLQNKETERNMQQFNLSTTIYNPITGVVPQKIKDANDLVIEKPIPLSKSEIQKLILKKEEERIAMDNMYKPVKTKIVSDTMITQTTPQISNNISNIQTETQQPITRNNYIATFNDMKREATTGIKKQEKISKNENYSHILDGLKDLGIIK